MTVVERTIMENAEFWDEQRQAIGYETSWSIWETPSLETKLLTDRPRKVTYTILDPNASVEEIMNDTATEIVFKTVAKSGTVRDLWEAAETLFKKAKAHGDWHKYVEDFTAEDDGSLTLVMGS